MTNPVIFMFSAVLFGISLCQVIVEDGFYEKQCQTSNIYPRRLLTTKHHSS